MAFISLGSGVLIAVKQSQKHMSRKFAYKSVTFISIEKKREKERKNSKKMPRQDEDGKLNVRNRFKVEEIPS